MGHHDAEPNTRSDIDLPSASCMAAPILERYGVKMPQSPRAPRHADTPPPAP